MEQQSQYLKNLLKRLDQASSQFHDQYDSNNPHSISTIKFDRQDLDSNYLTSKRDQTHNQNNNQTKAYVDSLHTPNLQGINETIDNTKTSRNSTTVLHFNQAKVRKRSEDKFDRQLSRRSNSSHKKFKHKEDMIHVREKLMDIVSFLNAKIESNPQEVRKVDLDYVKESVLPKPSFSAQNNLNLLCLPKFELHDAKLVNSSQILNNLSPQDKASDELLNSKHSFNKLNDIDSSNSLQERSRFKQYRQQQPPQDQIYRQGINIANHLQFQRQIQVRPHSYLNHSSSQPRIYINGRLNNSNSQSKISYPQPVRQIRPLSELPAIRYLPYQHSNPHFPQSNIPSPIPITNTQYLPIAQNSKPFTHPFNLGKPPTFRTVTSRPLSTQRFPMTQPSGFVNPLPPNQTHKIGLSSRIMQEQMAQNGKEGKEGSRLKKKVNSSQHFKLQPSLQVQTPKKLLTEPNEEINREIFVKQAQEQLSKIHPPKPYNKYSLSTDNPFKITNETAVLSSSKKSSKFRADMSYDILRSIAEQSQENQPSRMDRSGRSSGVMMSSVHQVTPISDLPKLAKFNGSGSTKLKRRGIDVSSSKKGYLSQFWRNQ